MDNHLNVGDCLHPEHADVWTCKIGFARRADLPSGSDSPMRQAVARAYKEITGHEPEFIFSGWCGALTASEARTVAGG